MGKFVLLSCCVLWPSFSFALIAVSARVILPERQVNSETGPKLSVAWPSTCGSDHDPRGLVLRTVLGPLKTQQMICEAEPLHSTPEWDTVVAQFWMWGRLWTFEMRESADLVFEADHDLNIRMDLAPAPDAAPSDHLKLSNVKLIFAPDEKVLCSPALFDTPVRFKHSRRHGQVCEIEEVEFAIGS